MLPVQAGVSSVGAAPSALPLTYSSQDRFQSVQPLPQSSLRDVPLTTTGSPTCVRPNRYLALAVETLVQPCDTLRLPWSPTDHGAAWMYCPLLVSRIVQYTVSLYGSAGSVETKSSDWFFVMMTRLP